MKIGIVKEIKPGERRVAATPETVGKLKKLGFEVVVESGAGEGAAFRDTDYEQAGAQVCGDTATVWGQSDIVLKVQPPDVNPALSGHEADALREKATLISFLWPTKNKELIERLSARKATVLAMDLIPRITRAQKMDALSSMANIAGYRAVIEAASFFGRFFTGQVTAAGKVPPAKVLIIGAGVAGLAAIGAARGLGAIVRAFDTRPAVREQVQSMGAEFLEVTLIEDGTGEGGYAKEMSPAFVEAEMALFEKQAREVDIIITTALIPGKAAPQLILRSHVEQMRPGSVVVDLAAESGGNCELTRPGEVINHRGVTIIGYMDLPSRLAPTASSLYGNNLVHLLSDMGGSQKWSVNQQDEVVRGALVVCEGEILGPPPKPKVVPLPPPRSQAAVARETKSGHDDSIGPKAQITALLVLGTLFLLLGLLNPPAAFLTHLTVFVLACFVGWQVVWNVTSALHTPLMSVTNAISGIILVGGMLKIGGPLTSPATVLAAAAVLLSTINIAGGFLVTSRMLKMFRK